MTVTAKNPTPEWGYSVSVIGVDYSHGRGRRASHRLKILEDFSHAFPGESMTAITGPSGCGKSTLLKLLAQFHQPDSGSIHIDGHPATRVERNHTSFLPQDDILPPFLMVREVFDHHAAIRRIPKAARKIDELLESLGLGDLNRRRIDHLSGGQRKRVSIGLELLHKPKLLLLDEPTASLDPENAKTVMDMLSSIRDRGVTIVIVTHRDDDVRYCCHHLEMSRPASRLNP